MSVLQLPAGTKGFDADCAIDAEGARAWFARGFRFAMRYVPRKSVGAHDLTSLEVRRLHDAGLAVGVVQHVEPEGWLPTPEKGRAYGWYAAVSAEDAGVPPGVTLWCDVEGIMPGTPSELVIAYANAWADQARAAGYRAGGYIGFGAILTAEQLYHRLTFDAFWLAYNGNVDQIPVVRGVCLRQHALPDAERPAGYHGLDGIDQNVVQADALGGLPWVYAPAGWTP